jgi:cytoskeletal protein RodZ
MLERMRRNVGIGVAWLGATVLSVLIATAAVAGIRDRVVETPVALGPPTTMGPTIPLETSTTTAAPGTTSTAAPTEAPSTTTTTSTTVATTETTEAEPEPTTTSAPTTTTTTTTAPPQTTTTAAPAYQTYTLIGGTVTLSIGNGQVSVFSVAVNTGFRVEIEKDGPHEVKVEFESNSHQSELTAKFEDGELVVKKHEEDEEGEDDH